jgi:hypothetical protein
VNEPLAFVAAPTPAATAPPKEKFPLMAVADDSVIVSVPLVLV